MMSLSTATRIPTMTLIFKEEFRFEASRTRTSRQTVSYLDPQYSLSGSKISLHQGLGASLSVSFCPSLSLNPVWGP